MKVERDREREKMKVNLTIVVTKRNFKLFGSRNNNFHLSEKVTTDRLSERRKTRKTRRKRGCE